MKGVAPPKATPQFRLAVLASSYSSPAQIQQPANAAATEVTAMILVRPFKHAMLGCVVCAAILTPTTDFGNMLVIAGPMIVLYCVGIGVAWVFGKRV